MKGEDTAAQDEGEQRPGGRKASRRCSDSVPAEVLVVLTGCTGLGGGAEKIAAQEEGEQRPGDGRAECAVVRLVTTLRCAWRWRSEAWRVPKLAVVRGP